MSSVKISDLHSFSLPLSVDINVGDNWGDAYINLTTIAQIRTI